MDRVYLNGIMGFAVGDALGAPAEFGERWMRDLDPVKEMRSGGLFDVPEGGWTDDTAMTIATLESLKHGFNPEDMMKRYLSWYRTGEYSWCRKPIGVGKQILRALERYEQTGEIGSCGGGTELDNGNGALMRMLPICLYLNRKWKREEIKISDVIRMVHKASGLTHAHQRSLIACGLYYFLVSAILWEEGTLAERIQNGINDGFAFYETEKELNAYGRLRNISTFQKIPREQISSTGYVVDTLEAVIWSLITTENFQECLLRAVNLGLDSDTITAIAGGLAGLYYGYEEIPAEWLAVLKQKNELEELCHYF